MLLTKASRSSNDRGGNGHNIVAYGYFFTKTAEQLAFNLRTYEAFLAFGIELREEGRHDCTPGRIWVVRPRL